MNKEASKPGFARLTPAQVARCHESGKRPYDRQRLRLASVSLYRGLFGLGLPVQIPGLSDSRARNSQICQITCCNEYLARASKGHTYDNPHRKGDEL